MRNVPRRRIRCQSRIVEWAAYMPAERRFMGRWLARFHHCEHKLPLSVFCPLNPRAARVTFILTHGPTSSHARQRPRPRSRERDPPTPAGPATGSGDGHSGPDHALSTSAVAKRDTEPITGQMSAVRDVLVVDHAVLVREAVAALLRHHGVPTVREASDGAGAVCREDAPARGRVHVAHLSDARARRGQSALRGGRRVHCATASRTPPSCPTAAGVHARGPALTGLPRVDMSRGTSPRAFPPVAPATSRKEVLQNVLSAGPARVCGLMSPQTKQAIVVQAPTRLTTKDSP